MPADETTHATRSTPRRAGGRGAQPGLARGNAIPLYHQIYLTLRDEIVRGERPAGSAAPTEMQLGTMYGVSRITARRALDELAAGGFVDRKRRTGTRVTYRPPRGPVEADIDQTVESLIAFGQHTKVKVLALDVGEPEPAIARRLGMGPGETEIRAVRLRSTDGEPLGVITSHIPSALDVALTPERLTERPLLSLLREAGVTIGGATHRIEALQATADLARVLAIEPMAAVLRVERLVTDAKDRPVLLTSACYRADRYRLTLDMHEHGQFTPEIRAGGAPE